MSTELQTVDSHPIGDLSLVGTVSENDLRARMAHMKTMIELKRAFLQDNLKEGMDRDYAEVAGGKCSLLKPGAEKLLDWHGFYPVIELVASKEDYEIGLFSYTYRCTIKQKGSNVILANCEGDGSTYESKYRYEWKWPNEVPPYLDKETLSKKNVGSSDNPKIKYGVPTNGADKRNTVRKMAQKRAIVGATLLATSSSDLFSSDEPDDEGSAGTGPAGTGQSSSAARADHGDPISDAQGKRLYAIRKSHNIKDAEFKSWLKAKYGVDHDKEIGKKIYEEICTACESGHLELPKADPKPADPAPAQSTPAAPGAKLTAHYIKSLTMAINDSGKTEKQFLGFLENFDKKYAGCGTNDILIADFDSVMSAWDKSLRAGTV